MASWQDMKIPEIRAELKRRDLPLKGAKATLVARLKHTDGLPPGYGARKAHYEQVMEEHKATVLANVVPFHYFARLPLEIQRLIWELSLPGPRILKHPNEAGLICEHRLYFPKDFQPPNPVALSICRESRVIALSRFKLCFGTTNLYADLPGGDILYLEHPLIHSTWIQYIQDAGTQHRTPSVSKRLLGNVIDDLEAVKHVMLPASYWRQTAVSSRVTVYYLRMCFKSLERVSLNADTKWDIDRVFSGYNHLEDPLFEKPEKCLGPSIPMEGVKELLGIYKNHKTFPERFAEWKERRGSILGDRDAIRFIGEYDFTDLLYPLELDRKTEQKALEMRVVELKHIPYLPKRVEERKRGFPTSGVAGMNSLRLRNKCQVLRGPMVVTISDRPQTRPPKLEVGKLVDARFSSDSQTRGVYTKATRRRWV